jgi:hypothetical protein
MIRKVLVLGLCLFSLDASAAVCLTPDGYVVPCTPNSPLSVKTRFQTGTLPVHANSPSDVYITGGGTAVGTGYFLIRVNKQVACQTSTDFGTTPIRHCVVTLPQPGVYVFDAIPKDGNFEPPQPVTITATF